MDAGAPKDFGIKFLNLECEFLRREMCSECGFLCLTHRLWEGRRRFGTEHEERHTPSTQGSLQSRSRPHIPFSSPDEMQAGLSPALHWTRARDTPHTHHTCFRQQQCHSPAQHLLRSQKPPYAISLSKLTREVRKWCPRSTRRPHDNSQKLQTDPAGHGLQGFPCATPYTV